MPFRLTRLLVALSCTSLFWGCADLSVLRTKELRQVETDIRIRLDSLQGAIDSLKADQERVTRRLQAELSALQRVMREGVDVLASRIEENSYALEQMRLSPPSATQQVTKKRPGDQSKKGSQKGEQPKATVDSTAMIEAELTQLYATARTDFNAQNFKEAFVNFKAVYERAPEGSRAEDALYWMGLCYERTGQKEHALAVYEQLLSAFPQGKKSCSARFQLARIAQEEGRTDERLKLLQELVAEPACASSNEGRRAAELLSAQ